MLLLSIALFDGAPGAFFLHSFNNSLNSGSSLNDLASDLVTSDTFNSLYVSSLSNLEFSQLFIQNITGSEASIADKIRASNWVNDQLSQGASRADTMLISAMLLKNFNPTDNQWGLAQQALINKIDVAKWYSLDKNLNTSSLLELQAVIGAVTSDNNSVTQVTGISQNYQGLNAHLPALQTDISLVAVGANDVMGYQTDFL